MSATALFTAAAVLALVVVVLVVWSAVEAVLWLEDHTKRIRQLEEILEDEILERALEDALEDALELEDRRPLVEQLARIQRRRQATITGRYHAPWSPLYDQDAPEVWADLTTAEGES